MNVKVMKAAIQETRNALLNTKEELDVLTHRMDKVYDWQCLRHCLGLWFLQLKVEQEAIRIAKIAMPYKLQYDVLENYRRYIGEGAAPVEAGEWALYDWDLKRKR